jgi:ABC-type amino acid transport substrate-binding protein
LRSRFLVPLAAFAVFALLRPAHSRDLPEVRKAGRLQVAVVGMAAFETEVLRGFARTIGAELATSGADSPAAVLRELREGRADVACGSLMASLAGQGDVIASIELFPSRVVIVNRASTGPIAFIEQLRSEKVAADAVATEILRGAKVPSSRVIEVASSAAALEALATGSTSAAAVPLLAALQARAADPALQLGVSTGARDSVVFVLRGADTGLRDALNSHIQALRGSQAWSMLLSRYLGGGVIDALAKARLADAR